MIFVHEGDKMPVCDTCKSKIDFLPYREVILDTKSEIKTMYYHYFPPCWDLFNLIVMHEGCTIISSGFTFDEQILNNPLVMRNFEKNLDLWI